MTTLQRVLHQWELEQAEKALRVLGRIRQSSLGVAVVAGSTLTLLLYLVYLLAKWLGTALQLLFVRPTMIRRIGPGKSEEVKRETPPTVLFF